MNIIDSPITDLANSVAHAEYQGFADIQYQQMDYEAVRSAKTTKEKADAMHKTVSAKRRPRNGDFRVFSMFPQTWGSTALGHGGMGGASVTTAYTIVLECPATGEFLVYFGGRFCYRVSRSSPNIDVFIEDCKNRNLASKKESTKYNE